MMENNKQKRNTLKGFDVPHWYIELEPKLIELMRTMAEAGEELKALRSTVLTMMEVNGIDGIESEFAKVTRVNGAVTEKILKDKLKKELPEVYKKYVKISQGSPTISVKLIEAKDSK